MRAFFKAHPLARAMQTDQGILLAKSGGMFAAGIVLAALAFTNAIRSGVTQDWVDSVAMAIYGITAMSMFFMSSKNFQSIAGKKTDDRSEDHPRH